MTIKLKETLLELSKNKVKEKVRMSFPVKENDYYEKLSRLKEDLKEVKFEFNVQHSEILIIWNECLSVDIQIKYPSKTVLR